MISKYGVGDTNGGIGQFNGCRLYTGLRLDYRLTRLWVPTSASRPISAVAELLVLHAIAQKLQNIGTCSASIGVAELRRIAGKRSPSSKSKLRCKIIQ